MDQIKIGKFIADCRKKNNLTQIQLAEKLNITDRAISKWENGKSMPDSSLMLELCDILNITVNDLLSGEEVSMENYKEKSEQLMLELAKQKEQKNQQMLFLEVIMVIFSIIILLSFCFAAKFFDMKDWLRIVLIVFGFICALVGCGFGIRIEQTAGYYKCGKCGHRYVPSFNSVLIAMHFNRTRYMKCPHCGKRSWNKKVISK